MTVIVDDGKCISCGGCVAVCPVLALDMKKGTDIIVDNDSCIDCNLCVRFCPVAALELDEEGRKRYKGELPRKKAAVLY
ncbi:MAG: 4Fe-4S binding protein [Candidatus Aenigmarchaeota archaeon]|nr:4Fe-4S binding protein [Candidatus Aenigmarchaeota archaeon]